MNSRGRPAARGMPPSRRCSIDRPLAGIERLRKLAPRAAPRSPPPSAPASPHRRRTSPPARHSIGVAHSIRRPRRYAPGACAIQYAGANRSRMNVQTARSPDAAAFCCASARATIALLYAQPAAARNSLSEAMLRRCRPTLRRDRARQRVRAVVIAGNGPAFCAGHDMKEMTAHRTRRRPRPRLLQAHHGDLQRADAADRQAAAAGDRRGAGRRHAPPAASWSRAAISRSPRPRRNSRRPASISACSARRRWWRCRATSRASTRWRCC